MKKIAVVLVLATLLLPVSLTAKKGASKHPFDFFNHEMHTTMFEGVVTCDLCHADPESYGDRSKVYRLGCHKCHKDPNGPIPVPKPCDTCHQDGWYPKPQSHKTDWLAKHQNYAKANPAECSQCHANKQFCLDCHMKRETVVKKMHRRNFKYFHSIEARANPRKCDSCHTVSYCQNCHAGNANSGR